MVEPYQGVGYAVFSYNLMADIYNNGRAERKNLQQIASDIDASYPWDERCGWRYKEWLRARREFFEEQGVSVFSWARRLSNLYPLACVNRSSNRMAN